jgi:pyrimidine deaminase RibD-like protein
LRIFSLLVGQPFESVQVKELSSGFTTTSQTVVTHVTIVSQLRQVTPGFPGRGTHSSHGHRFVALSHKDRSLIFLFSPGDQHIQYLREALSEAEKCIPTPTAFCVGCVLVTRGYPSTAEQQQQQSVVLARGHSRELAGNTHAEANALEKARNLSPGQLSEMFPTSADDDKPNIDDVLAHTDVYTTLEPCSVRTSGLSPCADALVAAKVSRCFIGAGEPDDFVRCEGAQILRAAGCQVIWLKGLEKECLAAARRGHEG